MSSTEKTTKTMNCLTCSRVKAWPDGFPDTLSNQHCWRCWFLDHLATKHPEVTRKAKRMARRRARRMAERNLLDGAFGDDKTLLRLLSGDLPHPDFDQPTTTKENH